MKHYCKVVTQSDMDVLIETVHGFHDSLMKEVHAVNRAFIDFNRSMHMEFRFDAVFLFQSQGNFNAIELLCLGIKHFVLGDCGYYEDEAVTGAVDDWISLRFDSGFSLDVEQLYYRVRGDALGPMSRLGQEVPHDKMASAVLLQPSWRQCGVCANAWQVPDVVPYSMCPECEALTELSNSGNAEPGVGADSR